MTNPTNSAHERCKEAVLSELAVMGATDAKPIDLYLFSPILVLAGFTPQQVTNALDSLVLENLIEYADGNRIRLRSVS